MNENIYHIYISWFKRETKKVKLVGTKEFMFYEEADDWNFCVLRGLNIDIGA